MRVDLVTDVFQELAGISDLFDLLRCFANGQHDWVADPEVITAAEGYLHANLPTLADTYLDLARKGTVATQSWTPGDRQDQQDRIVRVSHANLCDMSSDLRRPAVLVVEDQDSDGCFVRALATIFGFGRVTTAISLGWLEIDHGGGCDGLVRVAQSDAKRYRCLIRVVALLDSDRKTPDERTPNHDKRDRLSLAGIAAHVLRLREAENYVPNRVLAGTGRHGQAAAQKLKLLKQLTPDQRGYYDMKHGFGPTAKDPVIPTSQQELYTSLQLPTLRGLRCGFGNDLLQRLERASTSLTENDFAGIGDTVVAELRGLMTTLDSVI